MTRTIGRATFVAALLSAVSTAAFAQIVGSAPTYGCYAGQGAGTSCVNGGGSSLAYNVYTNNTAVGLSNQGIFTQYAASTGGSVGYYYEKAGSGAGQTAFLKNDPSQFGNGDSATAFTVHFGASDAFVDSSSVLYPFVGAGHPMTAGGGQFIQVPVFATPITIPMKNAKVTFNGNVNLTDKDLCGIFSGLITNWSATSVASKLTAGTIKVYWRNDNLGSGTSYLLTQHLAGVCNSTNTASATTFTGFSATTKFAKLFVGWTGPASGDATTLYTIPNSSFPNAVGAKGSGGIADGVNNDTTNSAIGYLSPDYTAIAATPATAPAGKNPYTSLFVAGLKNAVDGKNYTPTVANTNTAIKNTTNALNSSTTPPATAAAGAIQTNWVPKIVQPAAGYPIVGYTNWMLAQCYKSSVVGQAIIATLGGVINGTYSTMLQNNGFQPLTSTAGTFGKAVKDNITNNTNSWNININNTTACASVATKR